MNTETPRAFQLVGPSAIRAQLAHLFGADPGSRPHTWRNDCRLLVLWLLVWITTLLGAILSPPFALFRIVFADRHWRLGLLFFVVVPAIAIVTFVLVLLSAGLSGMGPM